MHFSMRLPLAGVVELLLPVTKPAPGQEWSVDALLRDAKPARQEHCGGCCGHDHHHDHQHEHEHAPTTSFTDAEVGCLPSCVTYKAWGGFAVQVR
jgi:hypothetical protein